jgi:hypothetical protein
VYNLGGKKKQNQGQSSNDFKGMFKKKKKGMHFIILFHVLIFVFEHVF